MSETSQCMHGVPISDGKVIACQLLDLSRGLDEQSQRSVLFLKLSFPWHPSIGEGSPWAECAELSPIVAIPDESSPLIVLEDFDGVSLQSLMDRQLLPQQDAFTILKRLAAALDHLHNCQHLHGALRPSSVMVGAGFELRIFDWMVVWKDVPAVFLATAAEYLAPERLANASEGPRADQFALGTIAHQLLLGRPPFPADAPAEKLFRIRYGLWDDGGMREIELATYKVYDRVFSIDPDNRFASCSAFVQELESASRQRSYTETRLVAVEEDTSHLAAHSSEAERQEKVSPVRRQAKGWWLWLAAAVLLALGGWTWRAQNQYDALNDQLAALNGMAPASADTSQNGKFAVCNSSPLMLDVRELAVAYWDQNHKLQVFNSTRYTQQGWTLGPGGTLPLFWRTEQNTVWDGSVLFYFARIRQGQKEYVVSGRWDGRAQGCLHLSF